MATRIYGASDDLIEVEGDVGGEAGHYGDDPALIICSDGTLLEVGYEKGGQAIWGIRLLSSGGLFDRIEECFDEDADPYSDVAHFRDGLRFVYVAKRWERVR